MADCALCNKPTDKLINWTFLAYYNLIVQKFVKSVSEYLTDLMTDSDNPVEPPVSKNTYLEIFMKYE